jgi:glycerol-3-phosphate dehydrogenase (NAD(P)+)
MAMSCGAGGSARVDDRLGGHRRSRCDGASSESRNRRAGELLAQGTAASEIPARVGQAIEALDTVPLLARALSRSGAEAPVTDALAKLIAGELPLEEWIGIVRTTVPPPARWRPTVRRGFWRRLRERLRAMFRRHREKDHQAFTGAQS